MDLDKLSSLAAAYNEKLDTCKSASHVSLEEIDKILRSRKLSEFLLIKTTHGDEVSGTGDNMRGSRVCKKIEVSVRQTTTKLVRLATATVSLEVHDSTGMVHVTCFTPHPSYSREETAYNPLLVKADALVSVVLNHLEESLNKCLRLYSSDSHRIGK